jgi:hypothetical protein
VARGGKRPLLEGFCTPNPGTHRYLNKTTTFEIAGRREMEEFHDMDRALRELEFSPAEEIMATYRVGPLTSKICELSA